MKRARPRLTYANVVSTLALFLVLSGGAAFAAKKLATNDIKPGAIKTKLLARKAVKSGKIAPRAVKRRHIAPNAVGSPQLAPDSVDGTKVRDGSLSPADILGGASVRATASGGPVTVASNDFANPDPIPLAGGTWTQGGRENNLFVARIDATVETAGMSTCLVETVFRVNGSVVGRFTTSTTSNDPTEFSDEISLEGARIASGVARPSALTAEASKPGLSNCVTSRIDAVKVVVIGIG
jgi:hypothetical protein